MAPDDATFDNLWYPQPEDLSPEEFERFVADAYRAVGSGLSDLTVEHQSAEIGVDGEYAIDVSVRYSLGGMNFHVVVEAKRHKDPIKRDLVIVLDSKVRSLGAQKGVMFSTSPYQRGALEFATAHGIALITITEGRFTFATRSAAPGEFVTVERARQVGLPDLVGHAYELTIEGAPRCMTLTGNTDVSTEQLLARVPTDDRQTIAGD